MLALAASHSYTPRLPTVFSPLRGTLVPLCLPPPSRPSSRPGSATIEEAREEAREAALAAALSGRSDATKRAVAEARHEALKRFTDVKAREVAARMARTAGLLPADMLPFSLVTKLREGHTGPVTRAVWADDGRHIASCGVDGRVLVWDTHSCGVRREYVGHSGPVRQVSYGIK